MRTFHCSDSHKILIFEPGSNVVKLRNSDTGEETEFPISKRDLLKFAAAIFNDTVGYLAESVDSPKSLW